MVEIKSFRLKNFRGAKDVSVPVNSSGGKVITLIGLNESGKTSVLEGISLFPISDRAAASMFKTLPAAAVEATMVPIHETGVFSGSIQISGDLIINEEEWRDLVSHLNSQGYEVDPADKVDSVQISKQFEFEDGDYTPAKFTSLWGGVDFKVRRTKRSEFRLAEANKPIKGQEKSAWNVAVEYLKSKMPNVVYFPNFIVDVPKKIYIAEHKSEFGTNRYYRRIIESALAELDNKVSISGHVLDRIEKYKGKKKTAAWISSFMASDERDKIDAVFSRLSGMLTEHVIGSWSRVFNRPAGATRVDVKFSIDPMNELPFVEIKISDGRSSFHLHQRSLGFRWFFSFLLFTRFGREKGKSTIFLLDEPAANLHAKAQAELLSSFSRLADDGDIVIYSTHSHHMINPEWLSNAYIVENEAIDYENANEPFFSNKPTNIKVTSYRRFVGENGSRTSYFQPVLDRLHYFEAAVIPAHHQVLVEGISDFYALNYALRFSSHKDKFTIVPGTGSGSLSTLVSLAMSRGNAFFILLDDDEAGRRNAERYKEKFLINSDNVGTIFDFLPEFEGAELENLILEDTRALVKNKFSGINKKSIGSYLAEFCQSGEPGAMEKDTLRLYSRIIDGLALKLGVIES